ncbi:BZ3500_MvSof-1268-A1-R1_Chr1-2g01405 [Microbotryum saponariae]|uniref:BZ3500_MvSof-1268-A1-R1_Chr1-2g01405 protein n=1 Tax=Microbotryum saponariae TaxID=289078 RepID=A0A2X0L6M8_9BASI|nr:BZ3500_MvSof-1268-A1-R1_Chr1-2g01405 [Microbotryum saponariae]
MSLAPTRLLSLHIELSKDAERTQYSTLSRPLGRQTAPHVQSRPMESNDPTRGEAGVGISNTEQGRSAAHSRVLKALLQSIGPSRFEDMAGTTRSLRWTGDGALAQRYSHFGSLDGGAVTTTTTLEIGSLICFGLKRDMHSLSCDQTAHGEEVLSIGIDLQQSDNSALASLVGLSNVVVVRELRLIKKAQCSSTHHIDGTMPFRMIDGRQVIESLSPPKTTYRSTTDLTSLHPDERIISTSAHRACQPSKEGLFDAWSHARHQPKRRAPQATFDRPPRARKRSERVFEEF